MYVIVGNNSFLTTVNINDYWSTYYAAYIYIIVIVRKQFVLKKNIIKSFVGSKCQTADKCKNYFFRSNISIKNMSFFNVFLRSLFESFFLGPLF